MPQQSIRPDFAHLERYASTDLQHAAKLLQTYQSEGSHFTPQEARTLAQAVGHAFVTFTHLSLELFNKPEKVTEMYRLRAEIERLFEEGSA